MEPYVKTLENYHSLTLPRTWLEAMVKAYIGDSLAADFYGEVVDSLSGESAAVLKSVLGTTGHSEFVIAQVRDAVKESCSAPRASGSRCW
ncbi:hydroxylase for synthesis of 2-methylthio-cis-ribozeatin in tRNA [Mycobacteroides abscessus subsp. abscessus]|nr:hydroxylase for synthesis of 2-methylthio-cis-ribozeatin in tRNA [Mycobacteroides abscessus subsp. abscessus]